jgi:hypothetical protein
VSGHSAGGLEPSVAQPPLPLQEFLPLQPLSLDLQPPLPLHEFWPLQACFSLTFLSAFWSCWSWDWSCELNEDFSPESKLDAWMVAALPASKPASAAPAIKAFFDFVMVLRLTPFRVWDRQASFRLKFNREDRAEFKADCYYYKLEVNSPQLKRLPRSEPTFDACSVIRISPKSFTLGTRLSPSLCTPTSAAWIGETSELRLSAGVLKSEFSRCLRRRVTPTFALA